MKADRDTSPAMDALMMAVWRRGKSMPCGVNPSGRTTDPEKLIR